MPDLQRVLHAAEARRQPPFGMIASQRKQDWRPLGASRTIGISQPAPVGNAAPYRMRLRTRYRHWGQPQGISLLPGTLDVADRQKPGA
jgi:hypothetical protein